MTTEQSACRIVAEALNLQGGVGVEDSMASLAAWDSLTHLGIVLGIEAAIGRTLLAEEIASIASVRDVAALLDAHAGDARNGD